MIINFSTITDYFAINNSLNAINIKMIIVQHLLWFL